TDDVVKLRLRKDRPVRLWAEREDGQVVAFGKRHELAVRTVQAREAAHRIDADILQKRRRSAPAPCVRSVTRRVRHALFSPADLVSPVFSRVKRGAISPRRPAVNSIVALSHPAFEYSRSDACAEKHPQISQICQRSKQEVLQSVKSVKSVDDCSLSQTLSRTPTAQSGLS